MKTLSLRFVMMAALSLVTVAAQAQISDQLEGLGSNRDVNKRAARLENRTRVGIVQGRTVDRNWRLETGVGFGGNAYGDAYVNTGNATGRIDLHVTPSFSVGAQYSLPFNGLTAEGQQTLDAAKRADSAGADWSKPRIIYPKSEILGMVNWYMTYGKINFFDLKTIQFDIYSLAGAGQIQLESTKNGETLSQSAMTWTAGGGIGFWITQHVTTRMELRYQNYTESLFETSRNMNLVVANVGLGVLW